MTDNKEKKEIVPKGQKIIDDFFEDFRRMAKNIGYPPGQNKDKADQMKKTKL